MHWLLHLVHIVQGALPAGSVFALPDVTTRPSVAKIPITMYCFLLMCLAMRIRVPDDRLNTDISELMTKWLWTCK